LVADDQTLHRQLVLITNIHLESVKIVQQVYNDWRLRSRIEHGYRFDQEQGLDVEDMRVHRWNGCVVCLLLCYCPPRWFL
jgi:hypothetical protein